MLYKVNELLQNCQIKKPEANNNLKYNFKFQPQIKDRLRNTVQLLTPSRKNLLNILIDLNHRHLNVYASQIYLANRVGICRETANRILQWYEYLGFIHKKYRGIYKTCIYKINPELLTEFNRKQLEDLLPALKYYDMQRMFAIRKWNLEHRTRKVTKSIKSHKYTKNNIYITSQVSLGFGSLTSKVDFGKKNKESPQSGRKLVNFDTDVNKTSQDIFLPKRETMKNEWNKNNELVHPPRPWFSKSYEENLLQFKKWFSAHGENYMNEMKVSKKYLVDKFVRDLNERVEWSTMDENNLSDNNDMENVVDVQNYFKDV